jgi:hypothetical protein
LSSKENVGLNPNRIALARLGFGAEVEKALEARADELVRQRNARRTPDGVVRAAISSPLSSVRN